MLAKDLVSNAIPPLKTSDTGTKALTWMNEFHVSHLPIINDKQFLGLISEEDILDLNEPDTPLGNHPLSLFRPYVYENDHIYDVIKVAASLKLTLIPVIDKTENYLGIIPLDNIIEFFSELGAIKEPGGIIVLEVNHGDYSLSEIARIVESNDSNILSLYIMANADSTKIDVTIKINRLDLKHIIATFERFNYTVKAFYQESSYNEDLKDNLDSLMNYLNI